MVKSTTPDPLRDLARSTYDFFRRFEVTPQPQAAAQNFLEETNELLEAAASGTNRIHLAEEAADVMVTIIGMCASAGVGIDELVEQIYLVIKKNDAKTLETHVHLDGKIRRKPGTQ
jgi:NTP pyrophosphatase (non-canonical NTP hydrolase)